MYGRIFHGVDRPEIGVPLQKRKSGCIEADVVDYNKFVIHSIMKILIHAKWVH